MTRRFLETSEQPRQPKLEGVAHRHQPPQMSVEEERGKIVHDTPPVVLERRLEELRRDVRRPRPELDSFERSRGRCGKRRRFRRSLEIESRCRAHVMTSSAEQIVRSVCL